MITIGIELNNVVRDINKQIIKYYAKEFDNTLDIDDIDTSCDVLNDIPLRHSIVIILRT